DRLGPRHGALHGGGGDGGPAGDGALGPLLLWRRPPVVPRRTLPGAEVRCDLADQRRPTQSPRLGKAGAEPARAAIDRRSTDRGLPSHLRPPARVAWPSPPASTHR